MVSRSFPAPISALDDLSESVACYTTRAAEKLRRDASVATSLCVFIQANPFKENEEQYSRSLVVPLIQPTDHTGRLVNAALSGLKSIYKPALRYKKSGVLLMGLHEKGASQRTLFDGPAEQSRSDKMMYVMDMINQKIGKDSATVGANGTRQQWAMPKEQKSSSYTTVW
jgi:DNA polymerase V